MPGPLWKQTVRDTHSNLDRCRHQIDSLMHLEQQQQRLSMEEEHREEVYKNVNTVVEVAIKTKRPSAGKGVAEGVAQLKKTTAGAKSRRVVSTSRRTAASLPTPAKTWNQRLRNDPNRLKETSPTQHVRSKVGHKQRFMGETRSSRSKSKQSATRGKSAETKGKSGEEKENDDGDDVVDHDRRHAQDASAPGRFQHRTLQVFLREMRSTVTKEVSRESVLNILDDIEFVASNLDGIGLGKQIDATDSSRKQYDDELAALQARVDEKSRAMEVKDQEIIDLKYSITRLTANNHEMLALMSRKVGLDEALKKAQLSQEDLARKLSVEQQKNAALEAKLKLGERETKRLDNIIGDLKNKLSQDLRHYPSAAAATLASARPAAATASSSPRGPTGENNRGMLTDLELSADSDEARSTVSSSMTDSAIDAGLRSESHPTQRQQQQRRPVSDGQHQDESLVHRRQALISDARHLLQRNQAPMQPPSEQKQPPSAHSTPIDNVAKAADKARLSSSDRCEPASFLGRPDVPSVVVEDVQDMSSLRQDTEFRAAALHLSETENSSVWSRLEDDAGGLEAGALSQGEVSQQQQQQQLDPAAASAALAHADENVCAFLERMRNQTSLNLTLPKLPASKPFEATTVSLQLDSTTATDTAASAATKKFSTYGNKSLLSESRFRQGLESSLQLTVSDEAE